MLAAALAHTALAGSLTVLDDLERRAAAALNDIPHATSRAGAERQRETLVRKLGASLGLTRASEKTSLTALVYIPARLEAPAPAILLVFPHEDPRRGECQALAATLARLGFIVLTFDFRTDHDRLDLIPRGLSPEGLIQSDIRAGLKYLSSRNDVDRQRLGLVGSGLAATVAAALNPRFSAVVLINGSPDMKDLIGRMRNLKGAELPDTCDLIPGLFRYAATEDLLGTIAPRPVLVINPAQNVFEYVTGLYRAFDAVDKLKQRQHDSPNSHFSQAVCEWLGRWLNREIDFDSFSGFHATIAPIGVVLRLEPDAPRRTVGKKQPTQAELASLLGPALPESQITYGLKIAHEQRVTLMTHPDFEVPATVFRSGPEGADQERGDLVAFSDEGKEELRNDEIVQEAVRRGWMVWAVDPRGFGELKASEGFIFGVSLLLGENFVWRQASDIRRIAETLRVASFNHRVRIYARGKGASLAAAYVGATMETDALELILLRDPLSSFSAAKGLAPHLLAFDALDTFDIPDLLAAVKARVAVIERPEDLLEIDW